MVAAVDLTEKLVIYHLGDVTLEETLVATNLFTVGTLFVI